uniref:InlB B-repeat-containing protein n=1 Tax=Hominenteromicrobium sp. TaxID=3073581 RepID=UPI003A8D536C
MKKKIIAVLLSACMLVSACPTGAFAMSDEETNTYTATGDVMQGGTPVVDETPAPEETATPEETAAPEETATPAPVETPTPAPAETPAPVEVEAQATPAAGAEETAPAKQSEEAGISTAMLLPDDEKPKVDTYRFYDADGKELTDWTQTVAKGEELLEPTAPKKDNARFVGWYDENGNLFEGFGEITSVTGGATVKLTAKFEDVRYVYFMNKDGSSVCYTAEGKAETAVSSSDLEAAENTVNLMLDAESHVVGWSTVPNDDETTTVTFAKDEIVTMVYPVIERGFWVKFDTDGGSHVQSVFCEPGKTLTLSQVPTRSGYTFDGWYIDGQKVTSVSAEATVTAHWKANSETEYTVIHWQENANDNEYSSKDIEKKTGATNSTTDAKAKSYPGFKAQEITQKTIAGDGSTIVNVYYKRNVYIVNFYDRKGKKEYTDLRISAKYGANISKKWPTYNGSNTWYVGKNSNTSQVNIDTMPLGGAKFYGPKTGYGSETAYYYVEVLPGESGTTTYNGVQYKLHHSDTSPGTGYTVSKEDQYPITGFTFNANVSTPIRSKYNNAKFYYTRNSYNIVFMNKGAKDREVSRKYQQNISDVNYNPTKPASVPANFTFAGWYDNEPCEGTAYVFDGKTMPAQNITLYAKWQAPVIEAKVYLTASADGEFKTIEIPYGKKLSDSEKFKELLKTLPEQPSAWIDSNGALFNVDTELYSSVTISPFFPSAKDSFTVTYVEDKNENVATDNQKYVSGSSARVLPPENSENFRAWKTEDGKLIHPGDKITVTKNTTLRAVYTNKPQTVTITYHYNFEGSSTQPFIDSGYPKNTTATVKSLSEVKFTAPTGYKFLGWATTPDSNKIAYAAGATVFVDANGDNDLYAVWQVKTYTVTWVDEDGTTLIDQKDYEYGAMPKFEGVEPTKAADAQYTYTFKGWDKDYTEVKGNQTYVAVYEKTTNKY